MIVGVTAAVAGGITGVVALVRFLSKQDPDLATLSRDLITPDTSSNIVSLHGQSHDRQSSFGMDTLTTNVLTGIETMHARYGDTDREADEGALWGEITTAPHNEQPESEGCAEHIPTALRAHVHPLVNNMISNPAHARRDCHLLFGITSLTPEGRFDPTFDVPGFQASLKKMLTCQGLSCDGVLDENLIIPTPTGVMPTCRWENLGDFFKYGYGSSCYRSLLKKYPAAQDVADKKAFVCWLHWAMHVVPHDDAAPYALVKQMRVCPF